MKNSIECNLVKDLLQLYRDDLVSEESRKLVEEHLNQCNECSNSYIELEKKNKEQFYESNSIFIDIKTRIICFFITSIIIGLILASISTFCMYKKNGISFSSNFDWITIASFSIGIYFIPTLAIFVSFIYYKTSYKGKNDFWPMVIWTFLLIGMLTLSGFLIWKFISIII